MRCHTLHGAETAMLLLVGVRITQAWTSMAIWPIAV